jgi:hypothetical protein
VGVDQGEVEVEADGQGSSHARDPNNDYRRAASTDTPEGAMPGRDHRGLAARNRGGHGGRVLQGTGGGLKRLAKPEGYRRAAMLFVP